MTPEQEHAQWMQVNAAMLTPRPRFIIYRKPAANAPTVPPAPATKPQPAIISVPTDTSTWPFWARQLAKAASPGDTGVGDVIHTQMGKLGKAFIATMGALGVPCRCDRRRAQYNTQYPIAASEVTAIPGNKPVLWINTN